MSKNAETPTTTHDTGGYVRTAIVAGGTTGSIDVLHKDGTLLARLNLFTDDAGDWFAVDVIDIDERFDKRALLHFTGGLRHHEPVGGNVLAVDMRRGDA